MHHLHTMHNTKLYVHCAAWLASHVAVAQAGCTRTASEQHRFPGLQTELADAHWRSSSHGAALEGALYIRQLHDRTQAGSGFGAGPPGADGTDADS